MKMTKAKAFMAAIGAIISVGTVVLADNVFEINETALLVTVIIEQAAMVYAVFQVPNKPVPAPAGLHR